jgi:hypothetical protein
MIAQPAIEVPPMLNMDYAQRLVIPTRQVNWQPSPMSGVMRKRMAYEKVESGHATSIVEFRAGSSFRSHGHPGGEEILVLKGAFSDQFGDYPAGHYLRNPDGFSHAPFSNEGCIILVKLNHFDAGDEDAVRVDTGHAGFSWVKEGIERLPLHEYRNERTQILHLKKGASYLQPAVEGEIEGFILEGEIDNDGTRLTQGTWFRNPGLVAESWYAQEDTRVFLKTGHLPLSGS